MNIASLPVVALFGSYARNEYDSFSDRDVLIIDDDVDHRTAKSARFRRLGWSPVAFSWRRLDAMAGSKRLFIQHLKQESLILSDPQGRLHDVLQSFRPAAEYRADIASATEFLDLLTAIPGSTEGCYWALDVLMVGLRALAILQLAHEGIYSFGFRNILSDLVRLGTLKPDDVHPLMKLRKFKREYRAGRMTEALDYESVSQLISLVDRRFKIGLKSRQVDATTVLELASANRAPRDWYLTSRRVEAAIFGLQPRCQGSVEEIESFKADMRRITSLPCDYGWKMKRDSGLFVDRLRRLSNDAELSYFSSLPRYRKVRQRVTYLFGDR